jgi:hypothetical protein
MRNDFGVKPGNTRFPYKGGKSVKSAPKKQTANDKLDESLGMRDGKESTKSQSYKDRRDESRGE